MTEKQTGSFVTLLISYKRGLRIEYEFIKYSIIYSVFFVQRVRTLYAGSVLLGERITKKSVHMLRESRSDVAKSLQSRH